jgi:uncharacterized protein (DUF488 family)
VAIYTIGYEGFNVDTFLLMLKKYHIDTVVDIREMPLSRKPGFSKTALANVLNLTGVDYVHMAKLGCPKEIRNRYKETGDWKQYTEGFLSHLQTQSIAISTLAALAQSAECVLLCYEKDYNFCHRSFVANAVHDHCGAAICHIGISSAKKVKSARAVFA